MRCTFKTVFYVNGSKERNGIVPIMGRVTINGTIAQFSCKQSVTKAIWDAKGNRAIGKSKEAKEVNFVLDNIKAQIAKHYQRLSDREAFNPFRRFPALRLYGSGRVVAGKRNRRGALFQYSACQSRPDYQSEHLHGVGNGVLYHLTGRT